MGEDLKGKANNMSIRKKPKLSRQSILALLVQQGCSYAWSRKKQEKEHQEISKEVMDIQS